MKKGWPRKTLGEVLEKTETVNPLQSPNAEFDYIDVSSVSNLTFEIEGTSNNGVFASCSIRLRIKPVVCLIDSARVGL